MKESQMTLFGEKTPRAVVYKSESHKLHQAFPVKKDSTIYKGMAVAITADGTVEPYTSAEGQIYLGIAVTDSVYPAYREQRNYPVEVTVMVQGFAIVNWVAQAAMNCGYVKPTDQVLLERFSIVESSTEETNFIAISVADEANEIIQVLVK